ncbi:hypothetical protein [Curtobacterium ammoniigenes]|uniref:hypothetical protein n=1 Tax=Curtobacterium ammoniigenes TaxID=395387 RepID=UPI00082BBAB2|nr:hypothetical protein [Curtobacterium ammoniigenes]
MVAVDDHAAPARGRAYRPKLPADEWAAIAPYVHDVVARATPLVAYAAADLYPAAARLVHFAWSQRIPLGDAEVFDPYTINRFVMAHLDGYNRASRNTMRARLRRMSEALLGEDAAGTFRTLGKADASRPYSARDLAALEAWSTSQPSEERRTSAAALLALGLGAGLTGAEIIAVRPEHLHLSDAHAVLTTVGGRRVPVVDEWVEALERRTRFLGGQGWMFRNGQRGGNSNLITDFVSRTGRGVPLRARRMRATWIVWHLDAGTPLKRLLAIAGLDSAEALDRFLPFAAD